ncbi:MAG TPA: ABC transporter ATP-binding protein [Clostridiales bacterium]|jgi:branched-chain amino acid transport system ATP-binding protein|nr:ABC transporter ATP-binding protein [Clostridiales bacterium]
MLKTVKLRAGYGKVMILQGVDFHIGKKEIISIIGRNGVGKSTLMKTLIGEVPVSSGSIEFAGKDCTKLKAYERAQLGMGYIPQGHGVFPLLTVEENLLVGQCINGNKQTTKKHMELVYDYFPRLKERRTQRAGTMSGGERAMLSIARILIGEPSLILFDEPSEGVQPNIVELIGEIILKINADLGVTILLVEQNIGLVQQVSEKAYVIDKGLIAHELDKAMINDNETTKRLLAV